MAAGAFDQIIGKTIARVTYRSNPRPPRQQVFLFFEDGTYFEVYGGEGEPIKGAKGVLEGGPESIERSAQPGGEALWFPTGGDGER